MLVRIALIINRNLYIVTNLYFTLGIIDMLILLKTRDQQDSNIIV